MAEANVNSPAQPPATTNTQSPAAPQAQQTPQAQQAQQTQRDKAAAPARSNLVQRPGEVELPVDNTKHPLNVAEQRRKDAAEAERAELVGGGLSEATIAEMEAGKKALNRNKPRE